MYVVLAPYLRKLRTIERTRPEELRRPVPKMGELAEAIGIHPATLSGIANNQIKMLNLEIGAAIIDELRRRGFETELGDVLEYRPATKG